MPRATRNLLGQRFGKLEVIDFDGYRKEKYSKKAYWKCKCDCGAEIEVTSYQLTSGHTKSCGCLRSEKVSSNEMLIGEYLSKNKILSLLIKAFLLANSKPLMGMTFKLWLMNFVDALTN